MFGRVILTYLVLVFPTCLMAAPTWAGGPFNPPPSIDTHNHLFARVGRGPDAHDDYPGVIRNTLAAMDKFNIQKMMIMPPPFSGSNPTTYKIRAAAEYLRKYPDRFELLGGGGALNPIIQEAVRAGKTTRDMRARFEKETEKLVRLGVVGLGEFCSEHFSMAQGHQYITAPPDHDLFKLLLDLAAKHDLPVDIHMEAVTKKMPLPARLVSASNPDFLKSTTPAFERLLAHNRQAKVIWAHVGWCNTGLRTPALIGRMLAEHPNLYMAFKISPRDSDSAGIPIIPGVWRLKPDWLDLIRRFPDRFVIGSDQFYDLTDRLNRGPGQGGGGGFGRKKKMGAGRQGPKRSIGPVSVGPTIRFLSTLPPDLAKKVGIDNARKLFNVD